MSASEETLTLLRSIDASMKELVALSKARVREAKAAQPKPVATDRDLDGQYGDPVVKLSPRDWSGPSFKGRHFSECQPAFLDQLAEMYDYFARKNDESGATTDKGKPKADYDRQSAARARGWAHRMRTGVHPTPRAQSLEPRALSPEPEDFGSTGDPAAAGVGEEEINW